MRTQCFVIGVMATAVVALSADQVRAQDAPAATPPAPAGSSTVAAEPRGLFTEPRLIVKGLDYAGRFLGDGEGGTQKKSGFYAEFGDMVTGAGWIAAGPGYRRWLLDDRVYFDASAAISWRAYKMAQARIELPTLAGNRLTLGSQVRWQDFTQVTYFGLGPDSLEDNRSEYRLTSTNVSGYATMRPLAWLAVTGRFGWLASPEVRSPTGAFLRGNPATHQVFPDDPVYQLAEQPQFLYGLLDVVADTRDAPGYPTRGGVYRAAWSRYADRDFGRFTFNRYEAEAAHFVPLANDNVVLALRGWLVGTGTAPGQHVPFYLLPAVGGTTTIRGFTDYRFHGRNVALVNAEGRVALFEHIDAAVFFDAGNVAPRFADLNLDHTSVGVGVRLHSRESTYARLDFAQGSEGWRVVFRLNDPFRLSRFTKRWALIPFAP